MRSSVALALFLVSFSLLATAHAAAVKYFLYFRYPFFDVPMHFLGGMCVVFGAYLAPMLKIRVQQRFFTFVPLISLVVIVSLLWELFEIFIGIPLIENSFVFDMMSDLGMAVLGGAAAYGIVRKLNRT